MKKVVSSILALMLVFIMIPFSEAKATVTLQTTVNGGWARIRYAANDRYVDIPSEAMYDNGTQLQIWDKVYGNQNQIFQFVDTGRGWRIYSSLVDKIIEVRDSSHDDYAQVAQWDKHNLECGLWDIIPNDDGTVSFKNRESGLFLNVCGGGDAQNGTKLIQYHDDGTIAMRFYLECMTYSDVKSASFVRNIQDEEIQWEINPGIAIINYTDFKRTVDGQEFYPILSQGYILKRVDFIDPHDVAILLQDNAHSPTFFDEIHSVLLGEGSETTIGYLLGELGIKSVPGLGYAIGLLQIFLDTINVETWNRFVDSVKINDDGRVSGIIAYRYYTFKYQFINRTLYISQEEYIEYKSWTGDNFRDVRDLPTSVKSGKWTYNFK